MLHLDIWLSLVCGSILGGAAWAVAVIIKRALVKEGGK